ncbi:hypothetical protein GQ457_04G039470 [Hibiscus cannabinus]
MIKALADKYPLENLLLVTHWEGVAVSVSSFKEDTGVSKVTYCGYSELRRPVSWENQTFSAGNFEENISLSEPFRFHTEKYLIMVKLVLATFHELSL